MNAFAATVKKVDQAIQGAHHILLIAHINPDGDALGSLTAAGQALEQQGKTVTLVCGDPIPNRFSYLPMSKWVQKAPDAVRYDLLIAVDCGDQLRMGQAFTTLQQPPPPLINIDHHITNTMFGDINLVDPEATSTAEILYELFREVGYEITADIALSLLTGLVADTMGFRTVNVTAKTLRIGSDLMDKGADLALVTMQSLKLKPFSTLQLWKVALNNLKLEEGLIWAAVSKEEREAIGYTSASSAGLVNIMSDVRQALISVVLLEMEDDTVRVGFRCHPPYSVSELATNLGGGGHPLAAGCTMKGSLADVEPLVIKMSKESLRQQQACLENGHH